MCAHIAQSLEGSGPPVKLQMGHVVKEVQLGICVCERMQIRVLRRERQRQRTQQIHVLLSSNDCLFSCSAFVPQDR